MKYRVLDMKPQVGIFEIVEGKLLIDTEDVQPVSNAGDFFSGEGLHLHQVDVKRQVLNHLGISEETKEKFRNNPNEYLKYPRGRVDYDTKNKKYWIMCSEKFITNENIEKVLRAFYLPPYGSGKVQLAVDENHYGY